MGADALTEEALAAVRNMPGVRYAEARVCAEESFQLGVAEQREPVFRQDTSAGLAVRVLCNGAWGFAALPSTTTDVAIRCAHRAVEIARAAALATHSTVVLAEEEPQQGTFTTAVQRDPFTVPFVERVDYLRSVCNSDAASRTTMSATMQWHRAVKRFTNTEGTDVRQTLVHGGAGARAITQGTHWTRRTCPIRFWAGGYELLDTLNLAGRSPTLRAESRALMTAEVCPQQETALILDTPQLARHLGETASYLCADRAQGQRRALLGGTFMAPDLLGRKIIGTPGMNLTAAPTTPGAPVDFGWDDEGVPSRRTALLSRGVLVGCLSSRETAESLGLGRSAGCMRAASWSRPGGIGPTNIHLEPDPAGPSSLDELIADTADGILVDTGRAWSSDDGGFSFEFACEAAWKIKNGKRHELFRGPIYTGSNLGFWTRTSAIGNRESLQMIGLSVGTSPLSGYRCGPVRVEGVLVGSLES